MGTVVSTGKASWRQSRNKGTLRYLVAALSAAVEGAVVFYDRRSVVVRVEDHDLAKAEAVVRDCVALGVIWRVRKRRLWHRRIMCGVVVFGDRGK